MTIAETARELGMRINYVYLLIREGKLTATKVNRSWLVDAASVAAYKEAKQ